MNSTELAYRIILSALMKEFAILSDQFCKKPEWNKAYRDTEAFLKKPIQS